MAKSNLDRSNQSSKVGSIESLAGIVILAGGNSRRMGTPKAGLTLPNNERLLDYHVRQAIKLNVPIMIADNERDFQVDAALRSSTQTPITHIADYNSTSIVANSETEGPLVAIESALQALAKLKNTDKVEANSLWLMVISCDSLINAYDLWQALAPYTSEKAGDKAVICLTDEAHLYPLLGLYNISIEPQLKAYIDSGKREVMAFIKPMTEAVAVAKEWQPLTNLNTPDDFKRACAVLTDL
ncbi:molybdenum cofactor guanylyltransferase [uncultured Psychrobacter sp.]|uniref:molybdenum cofactor guanylyltransferase n=1 Tax=uncultured Psychrobacter sp. TaxID=259303 RepID=UPI0034593F21